MAGWHHWLDGRESEWTPGVGDGQGGLACCDSWGHKESDMTEWLNWTEHQSYKINERESCSVVSDSLWSHELQHSRPPCSSPSPGVHSDLRPSSQWCHPALSSSVVPFSSCLQSLPSLVFSKFRLKLKKVGKTTRPFRYDLNQIPYDYTWKWKIDLRD